MKPNKFSHLKYRLVKIEGDECFIISSHDNLSSTIYDYKIVKTLPGTFGMEDCRLDIEHCVGYDEDGLGIWESYKGD